jgi:small-conductance mechanosensitive channel
MLGFAVAQPNLHFLNRQVLTVEVAKEVMREIAPELIANEPYMRFHTFNAYSIDFTLYMRVSEFFDQRIGKHLFVKKLHKRFQREGIQIPFPVRDIRYLT